ncbi:MULTISPECIES: DUF4232 domain-containing protein [Streptomyces]|uniref:DUF4232 domain-containing protein n=1 Tax=Streptomyces caniscabiei TaxID=2746961 RepID=A0ABU4N0H2_9ACTN|nr:MULTISPECIES: DUF4232 domain-containing protein [Streptomyces]MBE4736863.1 DUF4232 domain-containing protein [Streptomyces caniscabiei]MBE4762053.1 DUF4232 domain-containing protein [Streptomyces caniscabiei]MBE4775435.1 DUF4232 domain-containing protein [Streptomyces caniscabiei]MBE4787020.1 DUF4232 domain-containing protein [Streptomyces caniscabiei]MBE4794726.1 DUF4232 domain-containing protein [Streptomyces caniscabiei]
MKSKLTAVALAAVVVAGTAATAVPASAATTAKAKPTRCHTADLKAAFATGDDAKPEMKQTKKQTQAYVLFTNKSKRTCTLSGFAGVDMVGAQKTDGTWSLMRSSKKPVKMTLGKGDTVEFSVTLLPVAKSTPKKEKFVPAKFVVTPPNEKKSFTLKWPFGGQILKQDGATRPATYVNPIGK